MARFITFSRTFPDYHPRAGEQTRFVEQVLNSLHDQGVYLDFAEIDAKLGWSLLDKFGLIGRKHHTIRAGNRFKAGDWFSPRVWSGKPYRSKQIIIAPDIQVKKTWDFEVYHRHNGKADLTFRFDNIPLVAKNDGLELVDFLHWFNKPMTGQIICWNDKIEY